LGDYIPTIPKDPGDGSDYTYNFDGPNDTYSIDFTLEYPSNNFSAGTHTAQPDGIH
jgi:hypothetical protein